jgi:hypothetical protein
MVKSIGKIVTLFAAARLLLLKEIARTWMMPLRMTHERKFGR